jgi:predicted transcriptional regulator
MDTQKTGDRVWAMVVDLLRERVRETSQADVAKLLKRHSSTIGRYLKGERGEKVTLNECIHLHLTLGGNPMDILKALGEEAAAEILEILIKDPQLTKDILRLKHDERLEELKLIIKAMAK